MKKYKANATVLGLTTGDTFESDDQFYADISTSGIIEEVKDGTEEGRVSEVSSVEGGAEERGKQRASRGGSEGGDKG